LHGLVCRTAKSLAYYQYRHLIDNKQSVCVGFWQSLNDIDFSISILNNWSLIVRYIILMHLILCICYSFKTTPIIRLARSSGSQEKKLYSHEQSSWITLYGFHRHYVLYAFYNSLWVCEQFQNYVFMKHVFKTIVIVKQ